MLRSIGHHISRPRVPIPRSRLWCRLYHEASAHFQTIDIHGRLDEGEVPVDIDPEDALVSIPPEVGESLGVACALQQALVASSDIQPLVYRHATRSFTPRNAMSHPVNKFHTNSTKSQLRYHA